MMADWDVLGGLVAWNRPRDLMHIYATVRSGRTSWPISWKYDVKQKTPRIFTWRTILPNSSQSDLNRWRIYKRYGTMQFLIHIDAWRRELNAFRSSIVSFFAWQYINIEESSESKALSRFQVDFKQNRLRSTKPVVEVSKIDSTRLGSLKSTRVDFIRLTPRSTKC